jgi:hypothetical protein
MKGRKEWESRKSDLLKEEPMNKFKPVCPEHKKEMAFPTTNIDQNEKLILHGKEIRNMFHYCRECNWRYSSDLGEYFEATELPVSRPKTSPRL